MRLPHRSFDYPSSRLQIIAFGAASLLLFAAAAHASSGPDFELNQRFIERQLIRHGAPFPQWSGIESPIEQRSDAAAIVPDFTDPAAVLDHVFSRFPPLAVVYPTETYYYFRFSLGPRLVSGNVRLLDAHEGRLHIGYFDVNEPWRMHAATFDDRDGVEIAPAGDRRYCVAYRGRAVEFLLSDQDRARPVTLRMHDGEELVCGIHDESAIKFWLIYNNEVGAFYFALNEDEPVADRLVAVGPAWPGVSIGLATRFVFWRDASLERTILVGVLERNIRDNNYFDGPFDQVPPRLPIREKLEKAYPYVRYRGGIDEHGNFVAQPGSRVAISPYTAYADLEDFADTLLERLQSTEASSHGERLLALTYESKRDFHKQLEQLAYAEDGSHPVFVSQGWPANHYGRLSYQWPSQHLQAVSVRWPANHVTPQSLSGERAETKQHEAMGK